MKKPNNTSEKILIYIQKNTQATPKELSQGLGVSLQMIHRSLKVLVEQADIQKIGSAPQVFYILHKQNTKEVIDTSKKTFATNDVLKTIEENFYSMTPDGRELFGIEAFTQWCTQRKYDVVQKAKEYVGMYKKYNSSDIEKEGLDATSKVVTTFTKQNTYLDKLVYLYPYSLPVFGKTKISEMLFHAKQNQDEKLMKKTFDMMREKLLHVIHHIQPDAIGFIPPTLIRKKQIMKELQSFLNLDFPLIQIQKVKTPVTIQQKSLKNIDDRVVNADKTMIVINTKRTPYKKVLLIDDFTGSGSTLNEVAKKIKHQYIAEAVVGLTLTGSLNGFDVIREI